MPGDTTYFIYKVLDYDIVGIFTSEHLNLIQKLHLQNLPEVLNEPLKGWKERGGRCQSWIPTTITLQQYLRPHLNKKSPNNQCKTALDISILFSCS